MRCADKHHPAPTRNVGRPPVSIPWMSEADDPCSADCKLRHHQETQIAVPPPPRAVADTTFAGAVPSQRQGNARARRRGPEFGLSISSQCTDSPLRRS